MHRCVIGLMLAACVYTLPCWGVEVRVTDQATVLKDDHHNAFTDVIHWRDRYYVCFRQGASHMAMDGKICIMQSEDGKTWTPGTVLGTLGDNRDPHFTASPDKLYVFFGVWDLAHKPGTALPDRGTVRSYCASTDDGTKWSAIEGIYEPGWWLWRVRWHEGFFYSVGYTAFRPKPEVRELRFLQSPDGVHWTSLSTVTNDGKAGESDFWFDEKDAVSIFTRTDTTSRFYQGTIQGKEWREKILPVAVHSPVAVFSQGHRYIAGRDYHKGDSHTKLWEWTGDALTELLEVPSGGDTGYPGLWADSSTPDHKNRVLITWYTQHENTSEKEDLAAIYSSRIQISY